MEMNELIARINLLYHKRQTEGLTAAEQHEQAELRRQYIDIMKGNVQNQLERIQLVDEPAGYPCDKPDCKYTKN
ncbi:MAG TPA: hypothetical protein DDW65_21880 [Firmicutes bacterium]|jgi:uncharacterized protein YnzC (UPF0291/DUF896 family)|nr:hypothetical protein [Bacillota bacterium]